MKKYGKKSNNKFIGAFVNEMYAILLGIGIGNVLFIQQLNLSSVFEILTGLFVITVVLTYWWDWTEFINDNVVTSKLEFIIDFLILIHLEILFLVFNEPSKLALIFIILSVLDLLWVVNYIYYKSDNILANSKRWIFEKLLAIVITLISWVVIIFIINKAPDIIKACVLIVSFFAIRKVSFKQTSNAEGYSLSLAGQSDYFEICEINNSYLKLEGKKSFMITALDVNSIKEKIDDKHSFYVLKTNVNNKIVGFVELSDGISQEVLDNVNWESLDDKEFIYNRTKPLKYIEKVAINKKYRKKGMGKSVYKNLFKEFPEYSFFSFVMMAPYKNEISISFHHKMGFRISGKFSDKEYCGFTNYQSILFFHEKISCNQVACREDNGPRVINQA